MLKLNGGLYREHLLIEPEIHFNFAVPSITKAFLIYSEPSFNLRAYFNFNLREQ